MIDVLIVDDSPVVRDYLRYLLEADPDIRVVAAARDGIEAFELAQRHRPDVITMDVHMPRVDGLAATRQIMETCPTPILIVSASWSPGDTEKAFQAIQAGALVVIEKPRGLGHPDGQHLVAELVRMVKLMSEVRVVGRRGPSSPVSPDLRRLASPTPAQTTLHAVAIGASTGGPPALQTVLSGLPRPFVLPLLIVQHISAGFLPGLVDWLAKAAGLPVHIAEGGDRPLPGHAYLAPDGVHMGLNSGGRIFLSRSEPENSLRPAVSFLFRSVADHCGHACVGVLLTGMGKDGARELKLMCDHGAVTIAQDEATSVVHGMPGEAIRLGGATHVLPVEEIAPTLADVVNAGVPSDTARQQGD